MGNCLLFCQQNIHSILQITQRSTSLYQKCASKWCSVLSRRVSLCTVNSQWLMTPSQALGSLHTSWLSVYPLSTAYLLFVISSPCCSIHQCVWVLSVDAQEIQSETLNPRVAFESLNLCFKRTFLRQWNEKSIHLSKVVTLRLGMVFFLFVRLGLSLADNISDQFSDFNTSCEQKRHYWLRSFIRINFSFPTLRFLWLPHSEEDFVLFRGLKGQRLS